MKVKKEENRSDESRKKGNNCGIVWTPDCTCHGIPGTIAVTLIRIVLVGLSFGNPYSMIYGLSGSFLSLFVMAVLKKTGKLSQVSISVLGGIAHNIGQITFAAVIVQTPGVFYYLPFLLAAGCIAGTLIGIVGGIITERLQRAMRGIKK